MRRFNVKNIFAWLLSLVTAICILNFTVYAEDSVIHIKLNDIANSDSGGWEQNGTTIRINQPGSYLISGGAPAVYQILINSDISTDTPVYLTLDSVNITSASAGVSPIDIQNAQVYISLVGVNTLRGGNSAPGIRATNGILNISSDTGGSLTSTGGVNAAGIGGGSSGAGGIININGGTVTANNGAYGAGIGGGMGGDGGTITISGNAVVYSVGTLATGSHHGAGIGGGASPSGGKGGDGGSITIEGNAVVTAIGGGASAGIGGGGVTNTSGTCGGGGVITIDANAIVTAKGGAGAAAIGGGGAGNGAYSAEGGSGGYVLIKNNARVTAMGTIGDGTAAAAPQSPLGVLSLNGNCHVYAASELICTANFINGLLYIGAKGYLYGEVELPSDFINEGELSVYETSKLIINDEACLLNAGIIINDGIIYNNGIIDNIGLIINNGKIINGGEITGGGEITPNPPQDKVETDTDTDNNNDNEPDEENDSDESDDNEPDDENDNNESDDNKENDNEVTDKTDNEEENNETDTNDKTVQTDNEQDNNITTITNNDNSNIYPDIITPSAQNDRSKNNTNNTPMQNPFADNAASPKSEASGSTDNNAPDTPEKDEAVTHKQTELYINGMFADVSSSSWYYHAVNHICEKGLMFGITKAPNALFEPDTPLTPAMALSVIYRMAGSPYINSSYAPHPLKWYTLPSLWAQEAGITANELVLNKEITRLELITLLYAYAELTGVTFPPYSGELDFTDCLGLDDNEKIIIDALYQLGIISGYPDNTLKPYNTATRAEFAVIIYYFLNL